MTILQAMLLGLVQGLTEFLPVSSSGHLSILQNFFGMQTAEEGHLFFDVLLHLATLISVCVVFRSDIAAIIADTRAFIASVGHPVPGRENRRYPGARLLLMVGLATLPLALILPLHDSIEQLYNNTLAVGIALILTGVLLYGADRLRRGAKTGKTMGVVDALLVGLAQAAATVPGLSRSGTTIAAGMAVGLDRRFAVRFSFLISIPAVLGANLLSLAKALDEGVNWSLFPAYLLGMLVATVTGFFALWLLRWVMNRGKFGYFAYYCGFAGLLTIILTFIL